MATLATLVASICLNLALIIFLAVKLRSKKQPKTLTTTAEDLLHDLTRKGISVLRVEVIDPSHLFLRSPRG